MFVQDRLKKNAIMMKIYLDEKTLKNASNRTRFVSVMPDRRWTRDGRETEDRCSRIVQGYYATPMQLAAAAVFRILLFDRVPSVTTTRVKPCHQPGCLLILRLGIK